MTVRQRGTQVVLDVMDFGSGVADHLKPLMFEPFERLDQRGGTGGGTGVGLGPAGARGFLSAMGGSVTGLDTPGGGRALRVTVPVAETAGSARAPAPWPG